LLGHARKFKVRGSKFKVQSFRGCQKKFRIGTPDTRSAWACIPLNHAEPEFGVPAAALFQ